jgi:hypothetical protein
MFTQTICLFSLKILIYIPEKPHVVGFNCSEAAGTISFTAETINDPLVEIAWKEMWYFRHIISLCSSVRILFLNLYNDTLLISWIIYGKEGRW